MTIHADRDHSERPAAQLDTAEIRARALDNARTDSGKGRQPWRTLTDDVPALCDEVDRLRVDLQYLTDRLADRRDEMERAERERDEARATVARVEALVDKWNADPWRASPPAHELYAALRGEDGAR